MTAALAVPVVLAGAELTDGIQEVGGANRGRAVQIIQAETGNGPGDPWCASYVVRVLRRMLAALGLASPVVRSASCDALLEDALRDGTLVPGGAPPEAGDVFLVMRAGSSTDATHCGFVTKVFAGGRDGFDTIEGNTNAEGAREGTMVRKRVRGTVADTARYRFVRWRAALAPVPR